MTRALSLIAIHILACGAAPPPPVAHIEEPTAPAPPVIAEPETHEDVTLAISEALRRDLGFPVRIAGLVHSGDGELVLYTMNAATHWLARQPQHDALITEIRECEAQPEANRDTSHNCTDSVLLPVRRRELIEALFQQCNQGSRDRSTIAGCHQMAENELAFDIAAYCNGGFWARAHHDESGWSVADAGQLPETCVAQVITLEPSDIDGDGHDEILLDAVYTDLDPMRMVNQGEQRFLSVWHPDSTALRRSTSTHLADYSGDMGFSFELRCRYQLVGGARHDLSLECCEEAADDPSEDDGRPPPRDHHFATWPPASTCGPHWHETYPPAVGGGFRECHRVTRAADVVVHLEANESTEEVTELSLREPLHELSRQGDWIEIIRQNERGWIRLADTRDECHR